MSGACRGAGGGDRVGGPHVVSISLDASLADPASPHGDAKSRHVRYAEGLGRLSMIVYAPEAPRRRVAALSDRCTVLTTGGRSRLRFLWGAVAIGMALHRRRRVDLVTTQDPFGTGLAGWVLSILCRAPLAVQVHSDFFDNPQWLAERGRNRVFHLLGKWLLRRADAVRVGTTLVAERVRELGVAADRVRVIPVPVRLERFGGGTEPGLRREWLRGGERRIVLWVGRLAREKDVPMLLEAFARVRRGHPEARLVLCGAGPEEDALRACADALGISGAVTWAGAVEHGIMPRCYRAADVVVLTSRYEGTSLVLAEAAAAERPVVTTAVSGARDLVRDGETGFVAPVGDAAALAERIGRLLAAPAEAARMGRAGSAHVAPQFDPGRTADALVAFWRASARGRGDSATTDLNER